MTNQLFLVSRGTKKISHKKNPYRFLTGYFVSRETKYLQIFVLSGLVRQIMICIVALVMIGKWSHAENITAHNVQLLASKEGYVLASIFEFKLNIRLQNAIDRGVTLPFRLEFALDRHRRYWFNRKIVRKHRIFLLSYHAITRKYRVKSGELYQTYDRLSEALQAISRVRGWRVMSLNNIRPGKEYQARVHFYLDVSQLPKTFQINVLKNNHWDLSTKPIKWLFKVSKAEHE